MSARAKKIRAAVAVVTTGIVGTGLIRLAHSVFYKTVGIPVTDLNINPSSFVAGLVALAVIIGIAILGLYSLAAFLNLLGVALTDYDTKRTAGWTLAIALGLPLILGTFDVTRPAASWVLGAGFLALLYLGITRLSEGRWRQFLAGFLVGAPLYVVFPSLLLLSLPLLESASTRATEQGQTSLPATIVPLLILLPLALLGSVALGLPACLVIAADPRREGWLWNPVRRVGGALTLSRGLTFFAASTAIFTVVALLSLAYWSGTIVKRGFTPTIFGSSILDEAIIQSFSMSITCVIVDAADKSFPAQLGQHATRIGTSSSGDYVLVFPGPVVRIVPRSSVALTVKTDDHICWREP